MTWKVKQDSPYFLSCLNDAFITYNTAGSFFIGDGSANDIAVYPGYLQFPEIADPGNPAANKSFLYVADDGSGNTTLYFENSASKVNLTGPIETLTIGDNTPANSLITKRKLDDGIHMGVGATDGQTNYNIIICDAAYVDSDFGHGTPSSSPTLLLHRGGDPAVVGTDQWLGLSYSATGGFIGTGTGDLYIYPDALTIIGVTSSTSHSLGRHDLFVAGDLEVDTNIFADGGITVDPSAAIDCPSGSLNLGGTANVNFAGATRTAATVTHDGYVELDIAGSTYKFMLGS